MIKNIFRLIFLTFAAAVILVVLYVFNLPPFHSSTTIKTTDNQDDVANETKNLPADLADKIGRDKSYEEMISHATQLEQNGFPALAIAQYQEAYKKDPSSLKPLYEIGKIYLRTKNASKAEDIFKELTEKDPQNTDAKVFLGRALIGQRKISDAKNLFNSINESSQAVKYYQGIISAYYGENDQAKSLLNQSIALGGTEDLTKKANNFLAAYSEYNFNVESPELHLKVLLARSFNQCGEYEMAIPLLFEVTKAKLDYRDAWILLGYAYLQTEKYQDAIEALERAKVLDNQKPETLFYLGLGYYSLNNFKSAEENLSLAKQYGFEPQILVDQKLAEIYLEQQNYPKSAESYEKVLALNSEDVNYFVRPIWIYIEKLKQPDKALKLALKAAQDHPNSAMAHNLMGWTLIYNGQFKKAEAHLKLAMALDPGLDAVYLNYGLLLEKLSQPQKALVFYKKAHTLGQGDGVSAAAATRYNSLLASASNLNQTLQANTLKP